MHTTRGHACLGAWGYRGMHAIIALSRLCREESLKDQRHSIPFNSARNKKFGAVGAVAPEPVSFKTRGGGGWGLGGRTQGPGPATPPWADHRCRELWGLPGEAVTWWRPRQNGPHGAAAPGPHTRQMNVRWTLCGPLAHISVVTTSPAAHSLVVPRWFAQWHRPMFTHLVPSWYPRSAILAHCVDACTAALAWSLGRAVGPYRKKKVFRYIISPKKPAGTPCVGGGRLAVGGWRLAVGGGWWRLVVGDWWLMAVDGPLGRPLRAVLNKKKSGPLRTPLFLGVIPCCAPVVACSGLVTRGS